MADFGTLKIGDTVTHPSWADGETRKVIGIQDFKHPLAKRKDPITERVIVLDRPAFDSAYPEPTNEVERRLHDQWMEAGLAHAKEGEHEDAGAGAIK